MIQAISRIRSGTCRFEFVYEEVRHPPEDPAKFVLRRDYFLAFDEDRGLYRFDQGDPDKSGRPEQIVMTPEHIYGAPADYMTMTPNGPSKMRQFVEYSVASPPDVWQESRDPLIMPFLSEVNFDIYISHRDLRSRIFEKVLRVRPILRYAALDDGLWALVIQSQGKWIVQHRYVLDPAHDFLPIRCEMRNNGTTDRSWTKPEVTTTTWTRQNGFSVPQTVECDAENRDKVANLKFKMKWEYVNADLPADLFSPKAFSIHSGDRIVVKDGKKTVLQEIVPFPPRSDIPIGHPKLPAPIGRYGLLLILFISILVFMGVIYLERRYLKRRKLDGQLTDTGKPPLG